MVCDEGADDDTGLDRDARGLVLAAGDLRFASVVESSLSPLDDTGPTVGSELSFVDSFATDGSFFSSTAIDVESSSMPFCFTAGRSFSLLSASKSGLGSTSIAASDSTPDIAPILSRESLPLSVECSCSCDFESLSALFLVSLKVFLASFFARFPALALEFASDSPSELEGGLDKEELESTLCRRLRFLGTTFRLDPSLLPLPELDFLGRSAERSGDTTVELASRLTAGAAVSWMGLGSFGFDWGRGGSSNDSSFLTAVRCLLCFSVDPCVSLLLDDECNASDFEEVSSAVESFDFRELL